MTSQIRPMAKLPQYTVYSQSPFGSKLAGRISNVMNNQLVFRLGVPPFVRRTQRPSSRWVQ
jgi:hypothetical protein